METSLPYPKDLADYIPNVCPESLDNNKAFCAEHSKVVENMGVPSKLNDFISYCGSDPESLNKEGKGKMVKVLEKLSTKVKNDNVPTLFDSQGTGYLLRDRNISNEDNFIILKN